LDQAPNVAGWFNLLGEGLQSIDPSSSENKVVSPLRKNSGHGLSDAGRSASDQDNRPI
jgi:hypothetical protein